jgi:NADH dehydrogenase (ubiquinone) 1 alpha subcomplex subunit 2
MSGKYVFTKGLKELRFLFCQTSEASAPTRYVPRVQHIPLTLANCPRSFLNRAYPTMKKHNPHTPIMMREASGTEPRVFARYGTTCAQLETGPS